MKYLKTQIKALIAVFLGLGLMALAGEPVKPNGAENVAISVP